MLANGVAKKKAPVEPGLEIIANSILLYLWTPV